MVKKKKTQAKYISIHRSKHYHVRNIVKRPSPYGDETYCGLGYTSYELHAEKPKGKKICKKCEKKMKAEKEIKEATRMARLLRKTARTESKPDAKDMRELANLIAKGEKKIAYKFFKGMDTFVREGVPEEVFAHLCANRAGGKKKIITASVKIKGCNIVFKEELGVGVISMVELEFPIDATDTEMAMALLDQKESLIEGAVEVEFTEEK